MFVPQPRPAQAQTTITTSQTLYTSSNDDYSHRDDANYASAHDAINAENLGSGSTLMAIGQRKIVTLYAIDRGYLFFDTSMIPSDATILNYTLSLYDGGDGSDTDFNITIQKGISASYPHNPPNLSDYYFGNYNATEGLLSTATWVASAYNNMTVINGTFINKGGITNWCLRSDRDINSTSSSGNEYVSVSTVEGGHAARLIVWYMAEGYQYVVHGPYYDDGTVANAKVNVTLLIENSPSNTSTLDGTDGNADTVTFVTEQLGTAFIWNITNSYNYTRVHYLLPSESFEELYIFIPAPADFANVYSFSFVDMVGVTNAYLETRVTFNGIDQVVERQSLNVINEVPFWLVLNKRYSLKLVADQGTHLYADVIAGYTYSVDLPITPDMFPSNVTSAHVSVSAVRQNATWIRISYSDNDTKTYWVYVSITSSSGVAYSTNNTGNIQTIDWYAAVNTTDYLVNVTSLWGSTVKTWKFSVPHPPTSTNPLDGLFDALGTWPFPAKWALGFMIILFTFAAFTYLYMPAGCFAGAISAGILMYLGWWDAPVGVTGIALSFVLTFLYALSQAKREEREI